MVRRARELPSRTACCVAVSANVRDMIWLAASAAEADTPSLECFNKNLPLLESPAVPDGNALCPCHRRDGYPGKSERLDIIDDDKCCSLQ